VFLTRQDRQRLGRAGDDLVTEYDHGQGALRTRADAWVRGGHPCAALVVQGGAYSCLVYDVRPDACRSLREGSPECRQLRRRAELPGP
jgi:Fe-S-cluster containining protein